MIKTNKQTGQTVEIPDNTPPEQIGAAIAAALANQNQNPQPEQPVKNPVDIASERFNEANKHGVEFKSQNPVLGFLAGAANKTREIPQAGVRFLAKMGLPSAKKEIADIDAFRANHTALPGERAGEVVGDLGTFAAITAATGGASIPASAALMAGQHQLQNYGRGKEVSGEQALGDAAIGLALPYAGKGLAAGGKAAGIRILENVIKPTGRYAGTNLEPVLQSSRGLGKYFEGLGKTVKVGNRQVPKGGLVKRVSEDVAQNAENRLGLLNKGEIIGNFPEAVSSAETSILSRNAELGQKGLTEGEKRAAIRAGKSWEGTTPELPPKDLQGLIQKADDLAYKSKNEYNLPAQEAYSRELGRALRAQRESGVEKALNLGKLSPEDYANYQEYQTALRNLKPASEAISYRASNPSYDGNLIKDFNPFGIPIGKLANKAITRPGTANLLYDVGRAAENPTARFLSRQGLNIGRSAGFSPGNE